MKTLLDNWKRYLNEMYYFSPEEDELEEIKTKYGVILPAQIDFRFELIKDIERKSAIFDAKEFYIPYGDRYLRFVPSGALAELKGVTNKLPAGGIAVNEWEKYARLFDAVDEAKLKKQEKIKPTKLAVYDFDGTLFRSPDKPKGYKGNWWIKKDSLEEPNVPEVPDDSFWNEDVVQSALSDLQDKQTYTIMLTGRIGQFFEDRITNLLAQKDLFFDEVGFNEFGKDVEEFKVPKIQSLIKKHRSIKELEIWEDDPEHYESYMEIFSKVPTIQLKINKID